MRKKIRAKPSIKDVSYRANTRVTKEYWDKITELAKQYNISPSAMVRVLITRGLGYFYNK